MKLDKCAQVTEARIDLGRKDETVVGTHGPNKLQTI